MMVEIYTDGSARGNPNGPGGYGVLLRYVDRKGNIHEKTLSGGFVKTTNNRMELLGAIIGLEALNRPCDVRIYSDSKYLCSAFNEHWIDKWIKNGFMRGREPVKNVDLWKRLLLAKKEHNVEFIWIKGHNGHPENELCDKLATSAADADPESLAIDDGV